MTASRVFSAAALWVAASCGAGAATNEAGTPTGAVHGNIETAYRLAIVQVCQPAGQNCRLAFVDTLKNDDVAALVGRHLGQGRPGEAPGVEVLAVCAGSWLASVAVTGGQGGTGGTGASSTSGTGTAASSMSGAGTSGRAGPAAPAAPAAPAGSSAVCGYSSPTAALSAALDACDSQTGGACRRSGNLRASWGNWDGRDLPGRQANPGMPYDTWPGGLACQSALPLQVSASCSEQAVAALREAGVQ